MPAECLTGDFDWRYKVFPQNITFEQSKPHCCPVCGGKGSLPNGFYNQHEDTYTTANTSPETCRSCHGVGYIWG